MEPGDRVASEPEIMRDHDVSRSTAVRTLEHLEQAGLVRREQGRGTFALAPPLLQRRPELGSFSEQIRRQGRIPSHVLISVERLRSAPAPVAVEGWSGEAAGALQIVRVRLVDDEPVGVHTTLIAARAADRADIDEATMRAPDASLNARFEAAGIVVAAAEEHLQAVTAGRAEARQLGVMPGAALMRVVRVSFAQDGEPFEVNDARYLGDRFDYSVALVRPGSAELARHAHVTSRGGTHAAQAADHAGSDRPGRPLGGRVREVGRRELE